MEMAPGWSQSLGAMWVLQKENLAVSPIVWDRVRNHISGAPQNIADWQVGQLIALHCRACETKSYAHPTAQHVHLPRSKWSCLLFPFPLSSYVLDRKLPKYLNGRVRSRGFSKASAAGTLGLHMTSDFRVPVTQHLALRDVAFKPLSPCRKQKSARLHQPFCGAWRSQW